MAQDAHIQALLDVEIRRLGRVLKCHHLKATHLMDQIERNIAAIRKKSDALKHELRTR